MDCHQVYTRDELAEKLRYTKKELERVEQVSEDYRRRWSRAIDEKLEVIKEIEGWETKYFQLLKQFRALQRVILKNEGGLFKW